MPSSSSGHCGLASAFRSLGPNSPSPPPLHRIHAQPRSAAGRHVWAHCCRLTAWLPFNTDFGAGPHNMDYPLKDDPNHLGRAVTMPTACSQCHVSILVNSDTCPCPTTGPPRGPLPYPTAQAPSHTPSHPGPGGYSRHCSIRCSIQSAAASTGSAFGIPPGTYTAGRPAAWSSSRPRLLARTSSLWPYTHSIQSAILAQRDP